MGKSTLAAVTVGTADYAVAYAPVQRTGIDKDGLLRLKERHPLIYKEYVGVSESRRFTIKPKLQEGSGTNGISGQV
jgi:hypothetical protein